MAFFYMDTDGSGATSPFDTWAKAAQDLETVLAAMSAGDTLFIQGAAADDSVSDRTLTSPGTIQNPCKIIGVVNGTTNTGTSVVTSDLASTLPIISTTGATPDINFAGTASYAHIHISAGDRTTVANSSTTTIINGKFTFPDRVTLNTSAHFCLINSVLETTNASTSEIGPTQQGRFTMSGGSILATAAANIFRAISSGFGELTGVDISGIGDSKAVVAGTGTGVQVKLRNCKTPSTFNLYGSTPVANMGFVEAVACSSTTSVSNTSSIQDYDFENTCGSVTLETTVVRTGGADDGAAGLFAYAMTNHANATLEGSLAALVSPWMAVWVPGGASKTLTVFIANSTASTDYLEDEARCEFYTPDDGDTAQHDQTFDPANEYLLDSSTAVTDDTGSSWGTGGNNHQKFSVTTTPGFEGWVYARVHLAKRQASPDTLYLDPKIAVT